MVNGLQVVTHADSSNFNDGSWEALKKHIASLPNVGFYYSNSNELNKRRPNPVGKYTEGVLPVTRGN